MCYLRSTDVEQKNWKRLLWSFPDEMLYFLSQDEDIVIIDKSKHKHGKIEEIFCPVMDDFLNMLYFFTSPKNNHLKPHLEIAFEQLSDKFLKTKFTFWRKYMSRVHIIGRTIQVEKEPNGYPNLYYQNL